MFLIHAETLTGLAQGGADPPLGLPLLGHRWGPGRTWLAVGWLVRHKENDEPSILFVVSSFKSSDCLRVSDVGVWGRCSVQGVAQQIQGCC